MRYEIHSIEILSTFYYKVLRRFFFLSFPQCLDTCTSKKALEDTRLSCRLPSMNLSLPVCNRMLEIMTLMYAVDSIWDSYGAISMECSCPSPCQLFLYSVDVQTAEEFINGKTEGYGEVKIYFAENKAEVLIESEAYDLIQMVGEFGGCLGLFLGISLVSIYQFLNQFIRSFFARFGEDCR